MVSLGYLASIASHRSLALTTDRNCMETDGAKEEPVLVRLTLRPTGPRLIISESRYLTQDGMPASFLLSHSLAKLTCWGSCVLEAWSVGLLSGFKAG